MQDIIDDNQLPDELLKKRCVDLTGEDIYQIVTVAIKSIDTPDIAPQKTTNLLRGYKALANFLQCSVPTACRMVARNDIHAPAVIRTGKLLLFNTELVLEQLMDVDSKFINPKQNDTTRIRKQPGI